MRFQQNRMTNYDDFQNHPWRGGVILKKVKSKSSAPSTDDFEEFYIEIWYDFKCQEELISTSISFLSRFLVYVLIHVRTLSHHPRGKHSQPVILYPNDCVLISRILSFDPKITPQSAVGLFWQEAPRLHYATLRSALEPPAKTDLQPSGSWSLDQNRTRASPRPILMKWHSPRNRHSHLYKSRSFWQLSWNNSLVWSRWYLRWQVETPEEIWDWHWHRSGLRSWCCGLGPRLDHRRGLDGQLETHGLHIISQVLTNKF